jgi:PKHD-type hydroxylase
MPTAYLEKLNTLGASLRWELGRLNHIDPLAAELRSCRNCFVYPNEDSSWLFQYLMQLFQIAGQQLAIPVGAIAEAPQLVLYQSGDFFDWHRDAEDAAADRALTLSIQLTAPSGYEGGRLELASGVSAPTEIGASFAFPAITRHRVTPVSSGERYALVAWIDHPKTSH